MLALFPGAVALHAQPAAPSADRMVGYLPEWMIYSDFYPKALDTNGSAKRLTHILYAFANLPATGSPGAGTCQLGDP